MIPSRELVALHAALEEQPSDSLILLAMADWYEERDSFRWAECLRWLANERKVPFRYFHDDKRLIYHHDSWHQGWYWWTTSRQRRGWGYDPSSILPHRVWKRMRHTLPYDPLVFKEYPSIQSAVEALMLTWAGPPPRSKKKSTGIIRSHSELEPPDSK